MNGYRPVSRMERESVFKKCEDKLRGLVELDTGDHLLQPVEARTLVTEHRPTTALTGLIECLLGLSCLSVSDICHALALPYLSTAKVLHILREDHLVAGFVQQGARFFDKRSLDGSTFRQSHGLVDATRQIDHLQLRRLLVKHRLRRVADGTRHSRGPLRDTELMKSTAHFLHSCCTEHVPT